MGQRLNIEIVNGEKDLANCYYHWSACTDSALEIVRRIIQDYFKNKAPASIKFAVELLENSGGGVNRKERVMIEKSPERFGHIKFKDCIDRNHGLLAVTKEGMDKTREWQEGLVIIDLASEMVDFEVFWSYTPEEYRKDFCDGNKEWDFNSLAECPYDLNRIPFGKIDEVAAFINDHEDGFRWKGKVIGWMG